MDTADTAGRRGGLLKARAGSSATGVGVVVVVVTGKKTSPQQNWRVELATELIGPWLVFHLTLTLRP